MNPILLRAFVALLVTGTLFSCQSNSGEQPNEAVTSESDKPSIQQVAENTLKNAYFGETHLHTTYSLDAYIGGNRVTPEDAIRFARGEVIKTATREMRIKTPLDFCAVTDHAEYVGEMYTVLTPGAPGYDGDLPKQLRTVDNLEDGLALFTKLVVENNRSDKPQHLEFWPGIDAVKSFWAKQVDIVNKYNDPGEFTAFQAFEWSGAPNGGNLHRNVIFRDEVVPDMPVSYIEINREEGLWDWMETIAQDGSKPLAIPHNSNASKGMMFSENDSEGNPITAEYAIKRERWERLIEIMQIKGASEVHANFWSNDEFADFENCPSMADYSGRTFQQKNFVRDALKRGLEYTQTLGSNPYKLGMAGGTDNHNGLTANAAEDNYMLGSHGLVDATAEARVTNTVDGWAKAYDINPGAITGVWAESNTRGAIWDGMYRRESFATSGVRIKVRFFAGDGFKESYDSYDEMITDGYSKGVPMGGDLNYKGDEAPQFIVWAIQDPKEAPLERVQIIKGWYENGELYEKIYNVAVSDGRSIDVDGTVAPIEAAVDYETGQFESGVGSPELKTVWTDPDFKSEVHAFYYVRVLQIPTARWTLWDEIREGVKYPEEVPRTVMERAWTSPIWYNPND